MEEAPETNFKYIPSPINQLHVIVDGNHYVISNNIDEYHFAKLVASNVAMAKPTKFVYNVETKILMAFQAGNEILLCNIYDQNQQKYDWTKSKLKLKHNLPDDGDYFGPILGWNQTLFIFNLEQKFIECTDLKNPMNGHYVIDINQDVVFEYVIKDKDNDIHLLQLNSDDHIHYSHDRKPSFYKKSYHCKVSLIDLVPMEIIRMNQKDYEPLIVGYCKQCEKYERLPFIPMYLKQLILKFYPIFI